jgi:hypothetical protein
MIRSFRLLAGAFPGALLALLLASPLSGQTLRGIVIEQGDNAAIPGAVVTLMDESFVVRASTVTDESGIFTFTGATGRFTLQAEFGGLLSALSEPVEVAEDDEVEVVLALPSPLVLLAGQCAEEQRPGFGVLVGILRDANSEVVLPAGRVALRWQTEGGTSRIEAVTDGGGRYHFCSLPLGVPITARVQAFGRGASESQFVLPEAPLARQDFELGLRTRTPTAAEVQRGPTRGGATDPGTLIGRLVDVETRQPIAGAAVSLVGTPLQSVTDAQGRFRFDQLTPRSYTLHVQHLGYGRQSEAIEVPGGTDVSLTLRLAPQAIALEGVTVRSRSPMQQARLSSPTTFRGLAGADLRTMELRGAQVVDALRERINGLTIMEGSFDTADGISPICVTAGRRNPTAQAPGATGQRPYCHMVTVFMDDIRIMAPGMVLRGMSVSDVESVQFMTPLDAGIRFGLDAANGVLVIYTRGRGPFRDTARN